MNITVFLRTHNDRDTITEVIETLTRMGAQILVVDDCSTDGTQEILKRLQEVRGRSLFTTVFHTMTTGAYSCLKTALMYCRSDALLCIGSWSEATLLLHNAQSLITQFESRGLSAIKVGDTSPDGELDEVRLYSNQFFGKRGINPDILENTLLDTNKAREKFSDILSKGYNTHLLQRARGLKTDLSSRPCFKKLKTRTFQAESHKSRDNLCLIENRQRTHSGLRSNKHSPEHQAAA